MWIDVKVCGKVVLNYRVYGYFTKVKSNGTSFESSTSVKYLLFRRLSNSDLGLSYGVLTSYDVRIYCLRCDVLNSCVVRI